MMENQSAADEYREIAGRFAAVVEGVPDEATWAGQSPVTEWTARDVFRHLVEWVPRSPR
jgi:Mycothiol maleylpyruvate isomerase N-terminal domain